MNDAFTLPFRLAVGDCRKSFLPLDLYCSSGLQAPFRRERKQLSKRSIVTPTRLETRRRELRSPLRQVFGRNRSRYDAYDRVPATGLFPWQLGVRKFTYLPDCSNRSRGLKMAAKYCPGWAKLYRSLYAKKYLVTRQLALVGIREKLMVVYILKQSMTITKSSFAFTLHVTSYQTAFTGFAD